MLLPHLSVLFHELDASFVLSHLLTFFLYCLPPGAIGAALLVFPSRCPVLSSFCDRGFLEGDVSDPPPASPHQDGRHWLSSKTFKEIFL